MSPPPDLSLYTPADIQLLLMERAAIIHYIGGVPWGEAQKRAYQWVYMRTETRRTADGGIETRHTLVAPKPVPPPAPAKPAVPEQQDLFKPEEFRQNMRRIWKDY